MAMVVVMVVARPLVKGVARAVRMKAIGGSGSGSGSGCIKQLMREEAGSGGGRGGQKAGDIG